MSIAAFTERLLGKKSESQSSNFTVEPSSSPITQAPKTPILNTAINPREIANLRAELQHHVHNKKAA